MEILTRFPNYFYGDPLWDITPISHASGYKAAGSCLFIAADYDFYRNLNSAVVSNSFTAEVDVELNRYQYGDQGPIYSYDCYAVVPFSGVAKTSGGTIVSSVPTGQETYLSPDLATQFTGFEAGEDTSTPTNTQINFRYYSGSPSPTTMRTIGHAVVSSPAATTDVQLGGTYAPRRIRLGLSAQSDAYAGTASWSSGGLMMARAPHIERAKLSNMSLVISYKAKCYLGFAPNNDSLAADGYTFIDHLGITGYNIPVKTTGDDSYATTTAKFTFTAYTGSKAFNSSGGIFKGFVKRSAIGKAVADILDEEIIVGVKMTNASAKCYVNGLVVYDPITDDGAEIKTTGSSASSGVVGMGFAFGRKLRISSPSFTSTTDSNLQTYGVPAGKLSMTAVGSGGSASAITKAFRTGDAVKFSAPASGSLPAGITAGTTYYVTRAMDLGSTAAYKQQIYKIYPDMLILSTAQGDYITYSSGGSVSGFYCGLAPLNGANAISPGTPDMMSVTANDMQSGIDIPVLFELQSGETTKTIDGVSSVSVTNKYRRIVRKAVDFSEAVFAFVNDNDMSDGWYLQAGIGQTNSWDLGGHIHGHTIKTVDGFWTNEVNCQEDEYAGQL